MSSKIMFKYNVPVLLLLLVLFSIGCTKLSPELGFQNLSSDHEALTLETNLPFINATTTASTITFMGYCENKLNLKLKAIDTHEFKCTSVTYSIDLSSVGFIEGENLITIRSYDDSNNIIDSKELRIIKDTVLPSLTLSGPLTIAANSYEVPLYGTCSENAVNVDITEVNTNTTQSSVCSSGTWSHSFTFSNASLQTEFKFSATHKDLALNQTTSAQITATKIILGDFSIAGVSTTTSGFSNLLTVTTGSIVIDWTDSSGATFYNASISKLETMGAQTLLCQFNGLTVTALNKVIATQCAGIIGAASYKVTIEAKDSNNTYSLLRHFSFRTKAPPSLMADAGILYVNADFGVGGIPVNISPSAYISDPDSNGPFIVSILNAGGLGAQITVDNVTSSGTLIVTPLLNFSGIFDIQIRITDNYGLTSGSIPLKIAVTFPYSWTGFLDNDFNKSGNWCGVSGLKTGCSGSATAPSGVTRVMIDDLCLMPRPLTVGSCAPQLSSNTTIKSFYMKSQVFYQNSNSLTIGSSNEGNSYFKLAGGLFNHFGSTGDLTVYYAFDVTGGIFTAPAGSNVSLNTKHSPNNAESFKVLNPGNYIHNNSTLHLLDPQGGNLGQKIVLPAGLRLNDLVVNSTGGNWEINSTDLILEGDLILRGLTDGSNVSPRLDASNTFSKLTVNGTISCEGPFDGGTLPIYFTSVSTYKSTYTNCKMPPLKLASAGAILTEDPSSTNDLVLQGLVITAGNFKAPYIPRKLIFSPVNLSTSNPIIDLTNGFDHNGSSIELVTGDDVEVYKVNLGAQNNVAFSNTLNKTSFYQINSNFSTNYFSLLGTNPIPLRGSTQSVSAKAISLQTGLVADVFRLSKIIAVSSGGSILNINTTAPINLPFLELQRSVTFNGSGNYNFSGTTINLNSYNLSIPFTDTLYYFNQTGTGIISGGTILSGQ